jgi:Na+/H+ antiporter NhaD/arsenite permease-like protein
MTATVIFVITYIGVALGRIPGLTIDRVGIALLGAIGMVVFGVLTVENAVKSIDLSTILLLYGLMIASAQLRLGGFYTWSASRLLCLLHRPRLFLLSCMLTSGFLSSILANDIICFAITPVLAVSVVRAGLNPLPFLIGLAVSSNIGSAATIIGNPQNMLIGQVGRLNFSEFILWCGPPSMIALVGSYVILLWIYRNKFFNGKRTFGSNIEENPVVFNAWQSIKGILFIGVLVGLFFTTIPREISALGIAGVFLCSRKMKTRDILGLVDWHLITLFCALFIVIHGFSEENYSAVLLNALNKKGIDFHNLYVLSGISALVSNVVSNVPASMLLVRFLEKSNPVQYFALAVSSTFAGNLIVIGSIANLIVVEQAAALGIKISFKEHAVVGIPVTLLSLAILFAWIII